MPLYLHTQTHSFWYYGIRTLFRLKAPLNREMPDLKDLVELNTKTKKKNPLKENFVNFFVNFCHYKKF